MKHSQTLIGFHAVSSALKGAAGDIEWLRVLENSKNKRLHEIESRASGAGIKIIKATAAELDQLAGQQRHQGVVAGFRGSNVATEGQLDAILDGFYVLL